MDNSFDILTFRTRKEALTGIDINEYLLMAKDLNDIDGRKQFLRIPLEEIDFKLPLTLAENLNLYEILPPDIPVKPYFDCEIEADGMTADDSAELIELFMDVLKKEFEEIFNIKLYSFDFALLNSCRENKLSYHIVINNKIYFKNVVEHKIFINYLWERFENPRNDDETAIFKRLTWMFKGVEKRFIFDPLPYGAFQNFRLPNQSKRGKNYTLKNETDYSDSTCLIRLYNGVEDRQPLNVEGLIISKTKTTTKTIATKSTKTSNTVINNNEVKFNVEGKTLMDAKNLDYKQIMSIKKEYLRYLYLIPNTSQNFQFFLYVGWAISGAGGTQQDYIDWAKLYPAYKPDDASIKNFNNCKKGERTFGLPFLKKYAKLAHPAYFNDTDVLFNNYFTPNYDGVRTITETCPFVSMEGTEFSDDIFSPEKVLVLQAFLGKGKTTAIKRLIKQKNYKRILILSPRIAFSKFMATEFNAALYMDGDLTADVLVCSMESLHRLYYEDPYDIIIMDECEANLGVFSSFTMKNNQLKTYELLIRFITEAEKVIFASAFITDKTMNFVRSLEIPAVRIYNTALPTKRNAFEIEVKDFDDKLINNIKEGKKIYGVYCSIKQMNGTLTELKKELPNIHKNALVYSGKVDDSIFNTLINIDDSWGKASSVFTSPTITVGNSYSPDRPADFNECWIKGYPTCIVADTFQSHMRVRHLKDNTVYFSLPEKIVLSSNSSRTDFPFRVLEEFDELTENKRKTLVDLINKWLLTATEWDDKDRMEFIRDRLTDNYIETPKPLRELLMFCFIEASLSKKYYKKMFLHFLDICNYKTVLLDPEQKKTKNLDTDGINKPNVEGDDNAAFTNEQKIKMFLNDEFPTEYDDIEHLVPLRFETASRNIERKRATAIEKLQVEKYYFMNKIPEKLPLHVKREYFDIYCDKYRRHIIDNARAEQRGSKTIVNDLHTLENNNTLEFNNMIAVKLAFIMDLNARLGIEHSLISVKIPREKIEKITEFICSGRKKIHELFNLRDKSPDAKPDFKNAVALLDKVYTAWTGAGLKAEGTTKKIQSTFIKEPLLFSNLIVARDKIPVPLFCI